MTKNEWTTEEVLQDITKQLENKEKNNDLLRTRIRSKIRRIEKLCTSNKKLHEENTKLKELLKRVVNATDFRHEIKIASVVDYRVWYNIANEINQLLADNKIQANTVACNKIQENE